MNARIYLDNNAGTLVDPRVLVAVTQHLQTILANPSSMHSFGQEARAILTRSRRIIADFLGVKPGEIIFNSGGTEGLNSVLRGICADRPGGHIITSNIEHTAVYSTCKLLESAGCRVTYLEAGPWGAVKPEAVQGAIRSDTSLIAIMAINNETGVKTDLESIAAIAKQNKIPFLVDGIAWIGKEQIIIHDGISAVTFSGYKFHAVKGSGFSYIRSSIKFPSLITGGEQEFGRRGGTENLPGIVSMAEAISLLSKEMPESIKRMAMLRDKLEKSLIEHLGKVHVNGLGPRVCNTSNLSFEGVEGESLLAKLDMEGLAVSHGAACASGSIEPSRILLNMGISKAMADSAIRFSLSAFTTEAEIDAAIDIVVRVVTSLRHVGTIGT